MTARPARTALDELSPEMWQVVGAASEEAGEHIRALVETTPAARPHIVACLATLGLTEDKYSLAAYKSFDQWLRNAESGRRRASITDSIVQRHDESKILASVDVVIGPTRFHTELHIDYPPATPSPKKAQPS